MKRPRTTRAENILKGHMPFERVDVPEVIVEGEIERTHMQKLIQLVATSLDGPFATLPEKVKIISRLTSSENDLKKEDAGRNSEWIVYIPDVRNPSLAYFKDSFVQSSTNSIYVAAALGSFNDRLSHIKNRMGLWELQYLLTLPTEVINALLIDAGVKEQDLRTKFIIFPEIRFRANGLWHTLSLRYSKGNGEYKAYAIPLADIWHDDYFILAGSTK